MKNVAPVLLLCGCVTLISRAQTVPNGDFESWTSGAPTGWWTSNLLTIYVPVTQSTSAHGGSFAVQGTVISLPTGGGYTPILVSGAGASGIPINFRPEALHGWYKFASDSGDAFSASLTVEKGKTPLGTGIVYSTTPRSIYTEFVVNMTYLSSDVPDTAVIYIIIANSSRVHIGSAFTLDDLSYGPATGVAEGGNGRPLSFALEQNFPNPFNPSTKIQFQIPQAEFVTLKVYNLLGQEVATLVNEHLQDGRYRAEFNSGDLPSGMYIYRLQAGNQSEAKKLTILK